MERREREVRRHDPAEDRAVALMHQLESLHTEAPKLAEPMERLVARLIDLGVELAALVATGFVAGISLAIAGQGVEFGVNAPVDPVRSIVGGLALLIFAGMCLGYELGILGPTIGRRVIRLTIAGQDGNPASRRQLARRTLVWLVPALIAAVFWDISFPHPISVVPYFVVLGIGASLFVSMARDDAKRGWHDHLAGTLVVTPR